MSNPYNPQSPFPQQPLAPQPPQAQPPLAQPPQAPQPAFPGAQQPQTWNQRGYSGHPNHPAPAYATAYGVPPRQRNGLAIAAIAMSVVALLASLGVAAFIGIGMATASGTLTGRVTPTGEAVTADVLASELTKVIEDDGGFVDEIDCPQSSAVGQGLVTVCHGSVDDFDWTGIVVFEDDSGTFTLQEL